MRFTIVLCCFTAAHAQFVQQGGKLVPGGWSVAVSGDGSTAITLDNGGTAWVYAQGQGTKLAAAGGPAAPGGSVAISADGNTALVGGPGSNGGIGSIWVFTRANGTAPWVQQATLVGSGYTGVSGQGAAVALSADGNIAAVGGPNDSGGTGAVWIFTRANGAWSQQGDKLTGFDPPGTYGARGSSVALSPIGTFLIMGSPDNAAWIYTGYYNQWIQYDKLLPTGAQGHSSGISVSISGDGHTAVFGSRDDNGGVGAVWMFTWYYPVSWTQQKLVPSDNSGPAGFGASVSLADDGNTAVVGGPADSQNKGAAWILRRTGLNWQQEGTKLSGNDAAGAAMQGSSVALSYDATAAAVGGPGDNHNAGAAWVFAQPMIPPSSTQVTGQAGCCNQTSNFTGFNQPMTFTFTDPRGWQDLDVVDILINDFLDGRNACYIAYSVPLNTIYLVDDTGTVLSVGMQPGAAGTRGNSQCFVDGPSSSAGGDANNFTLTLGLRFKPAFAGNQVIYVSARDQHGNNSGWRGLGTWSVPGLTTFPSVVGVAPARSIGSGGPASTLTFTFTDANTWPDLGIIDVLINDFLDGRYACYIAYSVPLNTIYLVNDTGTALEPGLPLNGSGTTGNTQCSINGAASSVNHSGNTLTLTLNLTFFSPFDGNRVIYAAARSLGDVNNSGWQAIGSWTVQ